MSNPPSPSSTQKEKLGHRGNQAEQRKSACVHQPAGRKKHPDEVDRADHRSATGRKGHKREIGGHSRCRQGSDADQHVKTPAGKTFYDADAIETATVSVGPPTSGAIATNVTSTSNAAPIPMNNSVRSASIVISPNSGRRNIGASIMSAQLSDFSGSVPLKGRTHYTNVTNMSCSATVWRLFALRSFNV